MYIHTCMYMHVHDTCMYIICMYRYMHVHVSIILFLFLLFIGTVLRNMRVKYSLSLSHCRRSLKREMTYSYWLLIMMLLYSISLKRERKELMLYKYTCNTIYNYNNLSMYNIGTY